MNERKVPMNVRCSYTSMIALDRLVPHPKNPNQHPHAQIELLARIMAYTGVRHPIVVSNRSGFITGGHARLLAARLNKWTEFPVDGQDYDSEAQEYADMVADNKIAELAETDEIKLQEIALQVGPDFDFDMFGIPDFKVTGVDTLPPGAEDMVPSPPAIATSRRGEIYQLGNHRLMCGDSTSEEDVARLMGGWAAELCFTSPPYADQREYNGGKELSTEYLVKFIRTANGYVKYFAVNLGYSRKDSEVNPYWNDYIKEAKACGLKLLSWNVWYKGECGSIGCQTAMFGICHEWIFVFGKDRKDLNRTVPNKSAGEFANRSGNRQRDGTIKKPLKDRIISDFSQLKTVYECTPQKERDDIDHPARFPVRFPVGYIEAMTQENNCVYDPFGGSGSTLIACEKTNRRCFMMEIDPIYVDVIIKRWEVYTGKKAELISSRTAEESTNEEGAGSSVQTRGIGESDGKAADSEGHNGRKKAHPPRVRTHRKQNAQHDKARAGAAPK